MARGRAPGYADQREFILVHSARLFARRGYHATTMNEVAQACGLSKATLYHYYTDKYSLLVSIADTHVTRLQELVEDVQQEAHAPERALREMIRRVVEEYAGAHDAHRVLTEDVKFLEPADRDRILNKERAVVKGFAQAVGAMRPAMQAAHLTTPLTMLLFGMINWLFMWMRPAGGIDYDAMAQVVADLFLGGLGAVKPPPPSASHQNR